MTTRRNRWCHNKDYKCRHHKSIHKYNLLEPHEGPKHCQVPGCKCPEFIPAPKTPTKPQ